MNKLSDFINQSILIEYKTFFGKNKPFKTLFKKEYCSNIFKYLSFIGFEQNHKTSLSKYVTNCEIFSKKQIDLILNTKNGIASKHTIFSSWILLILSKTKELNKNSDDNIRDLLEILFRINSVKYRYNKIHNIFSHSFLMNVRDNAMYQFYRSYEIFIKNKDMNKYLLDFKNKYKVSFKKYFYINTLIITWLNAQYEKLKLTDLQEWEVNYEKLIVENNFSILKEDFYSVMRLNTFNNEDMQKLTKNDVYDEFNFHIFRNAPFFEIKEKIYIPIEGSIVENLQFNNLFYRFKDIYPGNSQFLSDFGKAFEKYLIDYAVECLSHKNKYKLINEFVFGKNKSKSSDFYIVEEDKVFIFEIKSSRILDDFINDYNDTNSFDKSFEKLYIIPWKQIIKSNSKIIEKKYHNEINKNKYYFFISVSMNKFPVLPYNLEFTTEDGGEIDKDFFLHMSVEEYELFLDIVGSDNYERPISDLILQYNRDWKTKISFKTFLNRVKINNKYKNLLIKNKIINSQMEYFEFLTST